MRTVAWGLLMVLVLGGGGPPVAAQLTQVPAFEESEERPSVPTDAARSRALQHRSASPYASLAHVVGRGTRLYNRPDSTTPVGRLPVRTPVHRQDCREGWCEVETEDERTGYVPASALSRLWLRVSKAERRLYVYRGARLIEVHRVDMGYNPFSDKRQRGSRSERDHWRTPEGRFFVVAKQPRSEFYKALVLNYPTIADAERGRNEGLVSQREYETIVEAQRERRMPPMDTELGGWIEIHGDGTGASTNWTQGCVAVQNRIMDELWVDVEVGTPVLIE